MEQTRRAFAALVAPGGGRLDGDLDQGAMLIATALDPTIVVADQLRRLDTLAHGLDAATPGELAVAMFGGAEPDPAVHFSGNRADYHDPQNSLLHRVLDRRTGIPISLAVLLIEVGRRRDISLHGVGMPGHFLVGSTDGFIDPFHGGVLLDGRGCEQLFQRLAGRPVPLPPGSLDRTPPAMILKRMLINLAAIGAAEQQHRRARRAVRALLAAFPDATHRDHVQHAYAAAELGQFDEAASAAEAALPTIPEQVRDKLQLQIDSWHARLN